ncbi:MAG: hypothetical protein U0746_22560 [Gemmataceae bacterium]
MPDPLLIVGASILAGVVAAFTVLAFGRTLRTPRTGLATAGSALGAGAGILAGAWMLGLAPQFPPIEDRDRFLLIVIPAAVLVEAISAVSGRGRWLLRFVVAVAVVPVLLHGSSYMTDLSGPNSREWSPTQALAIAFGLGTACLIVLAGVSRAADRAGVASLGLAGAVAAVAVMLSGYATGGQLGFALAGALAGVVTASLIVSGPILGGAAGVGVVGLFSLLVIGRFFGNLSTTNAALLFAAPLVGSLMGRARGGRPSPWLWNAGRLSLTLVPAAMALALAVQQFSTNSTRPAADGTGPSASDYLNFGK